MGIVKDTLYRLSNQKLLPLFKKQPVFPYYHLVRDNKVAHIENLYEYKNVAQFRADIDFLKNHYKPASLTDLLNGQVPDNSFLLSFDDGLEEVYSVIFPILKEKGLKGIFFINPDFVDNKQSLYKHDISIIISHLKAIGFDPKITLGICTILGIGDVSDTELERQLKNIKFADRNQVTAILEILQIDIPKYLSEQKPYISKAQIREMLDAGFWFGGHTMSHPPLLQLDLEAQKSEIINSIEWLKTNFGIDYSLFAFPFSDKNMPRKLLDGLFAYDKNLLLFGNSGLRKDYDKRIIQRFSLENPHRQTAKQVITENLYKYFHKGTGQYHIRRK